MSIVGDRQYSARCLTFYDRCPAVHRLILLCVMHIGVLLTITNTMAGTSVLSFLKNGNERSVSKQFQLRQGNSKTKSYTWLSDISYTGSIIERNVFKFITCIFSYNLYFIICIL